MTNRDTLDGLVLTPHFLSQMRTKGFTGAQVRSAIRNPEKVTDVRRYPGQLRYCGAGVAVVIDFTGDAPRAMTLYADGVVTPMRADQMRDPAALSSARLARVR